MAEGRSRGQPTKFTAETKEKILYAISKGAPYRLACDYARVDYTTICLWRAKAETDKIEEYINFFNDIKEAQASTALHWLQKIDEAMDEGTWTAAAWKLERRQGRYFAPQAAIIDANERIDKLEEGSKNEKGKGIQERREENAEQDGKEDGEEN